MVLVNRSIVAMAAARGENPSEKVEFTAEKENCDFEFSSDRPLKQRHRIDLSDDKIERSCDQEGLSAASYTILGELGGVWASSKVWQKGLNRLVALKMMQPQADSIRLSVRAVFFVALRRS